MMAVCVTLHANFIALYSMMRDEACVVTCDQDQLSCQMRNATAYHVRCVHVTKMQILV